MRILFLLLVLLLPTQAFALVSLSNSGFLKVIYGTDDNEIAVIEADGILTVTHNGMIEGTFTANDVRNINIGTSHGADSVVVDGVTVGRLQIRGGNGSHPSGGPTQPGVSITVKNSVLSTLGMSTGNAADEFTVRDTFVAGSVSASPSHGDVTFNFNNLTVGRNLTAWAGSGIGNSNYNIWMTTARRFRGNGNYNDTMRVGLSTFNRFEWTPFGGLDVFIETAPNFLGRTRFKNIELFLVEGDT